MKWIFLGRSVWALIRMRFLGTNRSVAARELPQASSGTKSLRRKIISGRHFRIAAKELLEETGV